MTVQELIQALQAPGIDPACEVIICGDFPQAVTTVIRGRQDSDDICWDDRDFKILSHNAPPLEETTRVVLIDGDR